MLLRNPGLTGPYLRGDLARGWPTQLPGRPPSLQQGPDPQLEEAAAEHLRDQETLEEPRVAANVHYGAEGEEERASPVQGPSAVRGGLPQLQ